MGQVGLKPYLLHQQLFEAPFCGAFLILWLVDSHRQTITNFVQVDECTNFNGFTKSKKVAISKSSTNFVQLLE